MPNQNLDFLRILWAMVLLSMLVFIGIWDILVSYWYGPEFTVSAITREWAKSYPGMVLLFGYLLGHLFG